MSIFKDKVVPSSSHSHCPSNSKEYHRSQTHWGKPANQRHAKHYR